ncbi:MAG: bifunctional phosphopantothenoylcysteine decarboxylase/phosphopantothenate--cysteine ligase CoaBC, partial [Terriglobales bacterium]
ANSAIEHISEAQSTQALIIAPATADILARLAHGMADDFLTTMALATPAPLILAPAMNVQMWRHPATQENVARLRARGVIEVAPESGYLACGMVGEGRMAELDAIVAAAEAAAQPRERRDLAGEVILITAGPTREPLDPVRFLSNRSSGKMGYALAAEAAGRGARVRLVSGPVHLDPPAGVEMVGVTTAEEMVTAAEAAFDSCTVAVLAAAVADYRPAVAAAQKIKKSAAPPPLALVATPDILARLGRRKTLQLLIGFAAETDAGRALEHARQKLEAKNADLIVLNDVSRADIGFDAEENEVTLVTRTGETVLARASKSRIASRIFDAVLQLPRHAPAHA